MQSVWRSGTSKYQCENIVLLIILLTPPLKSKLASLKGTHEEILSFVDRFDVREKLIWFEKGDVNGGNSREVFSFLKRELPNSDGTVDVRWNFAKFLVDHEGKQYKRFGPQCSPFAMKEDIEKLLKKAKL